MSGNGTKVDHWLACVVIVTLACILGMAMGMLARYVAALLGL